MRQLAELNKFDQGELLTAATEVQEREAKADSLVEAKADELEMLSEENAQQKEALEAQSKTMRQQSEAIEAIQRRMQDTKEEWASAKKDHRAQIAHKDHQIRQISNMTIVPANPPPLLRIIVPSSMLSTASEAMASPMRLMQYVGSPISRK